MESVLDMLVEVAGHGIRTMKGWDIINLLFFT